MPSPACGLSADLATVVGYLIVSRRFLTPHDSEFAHRCVCVCVFVDTSTEISAFYGHIYGFACVGVCAKM